MLKRIWIPVLFAIVMMIGYAPRVCAQLPADQMSTLALGEPKPDWVYVLDIQFPVALIDKVWIIDGDSRKLVGQLSAGYLANFEVSPDHREMYTVDTYYSRGWRGTRTDVVTIFDAKTTN
ncbi:MAG TPA: amine dehydrogenase large subunit, partial [Candidatus Binataceae bacterium]|nr:amine dehydrogenase large subunit [Candidatus Binataceae bacterium]